MGRIRSGGFMKKPKIMAIVGAVITTVAAVLPIFGIEITPDQQNNILVGVGAIVGIVLSVFGDPPKPEKKP